MNRATLPNIYARADAKTPNRCCSCTQTCVPVVLTGDAVDITQNSAMIINNTYSGIIGITDFVGVQYSTDPTMTGALAVHGAVASPFSVMLTGLQPHTTYYYRAFVSASSGSYLGEIKAFTTLQIIMYTVMFEANGGNPIPAPQTVPAGGKVVRPAEPSRAGYTFAGWYANADFSGSAWNFDFDTVMGNMTLYARWQASINIVTGDAANITPTTATIFNNTYSGTSGTINFVGVEYSLNPSLSPALLSYGEVGSPFLVLLTGLQPGTTYYYRAIVNASGENFFGVVKAFTTPMFN